MSCIFCKIASKEIPSKLLFEDDRLVAFDDLSPQAPIHFLVIPKIHVTSLNDLADTELAGHLLLKAKEIAVQKGIHQSGYRLVINTLENGGQSVFHLHLHVMGDRKMLWPPG